jgi:hypothetical protein
VARGLAPALAAFACAASLAGCGGGEAERERQTEPPKISRDVADNLAARSDAIADKLDARDVCGAAVEADALVDQARAAVDAGDVPARYEDELIETAVELQNTINCPRPPPPSPQPQEQGQEEDKKGKGNEDGKGKGKGDGDDEGSGTLTVETGVTVGEGG